MKRYVFIFVLLSVACSAQVGYRSAIKAGYGLAERRDSVLQFRIDAPTLKVLGDSLGYGAASHKDTVYTPMTLYTPGDTSMWQWMGAMNNYASQPFRQFASFFTDAEYKVVGVYITHGRPDAQGFMDTRDTAVRYDSSTVVIPRGSFVHTCYMSSAMYSASAQTYPNPSTKSQQVGIYWYPGNEKVKVWASYGPYFHLAFQRVQVPLVLGAAGQVGVKTDSEVRVQIKLVKI